ncbi:MAG: hypothetical protein LBU62_04915 [Bacteroidales bacterium]|jgi:hypothetical protein|nr:hypothetical protein [Bacteroidales bacterium]
MFYIVECPQFALPQATLRSPAVMKIKPFGHHNLIHPARFQRQSIYFIIKYFICPSKQFCPQ